MHTGTGIVDQQFAVFREAIELLGLPTPETAGQRTFPLAYVLSRILNDGVIVIGEQLRGLGTGGSPPQQPGPYPWEALVSPARSRAAWQLPLRLFELKNGSPGERARYRAVQETFARLAPGRALDVRFQAATMESLQAAPVGAGEVALVGQRAADEQPGPVYPAAVITVVIDRPGGAGMHPDELVVQLHGAGTWEALVIAEALTDAADRLVIFDEPAVTLHPTWQRALRAMIGESAGQFLVITHSADLVPMGNAGDLANLVRIENQTGQTRAHRFDHASLSRDDVCRITREFALSADATALLFARGVVLVEGETELGALPEWFARHAHSSGCTPPADLDLGFWSVGGDNNFRTYLTVLHALAIPRVVVCDGAAFDVEKRQARNPHIFDQVLKAGIDDPALARFMHRLDTGNRKRVMNRRMFTGERKLGRQHGIFTLARGWTTSSKATKTPGDESFEAFIESVAPGEPRQAENEVGDSKVRKGRWLGANIACPAEVADLYDQLLGALSHRESPINSTRSTAQWPLLILGVLRLPVLHAAVAITLDALMQPISAAQRALERSLMPRSALGCHPVPPAGATQACCRGRGCRAVPRELGSRLMIVRDGSPGVLYVIVCGAPAASSVDEFIRLAQDAGWLVRVIATPMGEWFIDAAQLPRSPGTGCAPGSGCQMSRTNSLPPMRSWWPRPPSTP